MIVSLRRRLDSSGSAASSSFFCFFFFLDFLLCFVEFAFQPKFILHQNEFIDQHIHLHSKETFHPLNLFQVRLNPHRSQLLRIIQNICVNLRILHEDVDVFGPNRGNKLSHRVLELLRWRHLLGPLLLINRLLFYVADLLSDEITDELTLFITAVLG